MKRFLYTAAVVLGICGTAIAELKEDKRDFELTAVAPPVPALKYRLLLDNLPEQSAGNAALLYLQAVLIMGNEPIEKANKALEAFEAKDTKTFDSLAEALDPPGLFQVLTLAAHRPECDWQAPLREMGAETRLPYLQPLREVSKVIKVRALRQIGQGKTADAVGTLRLGYDLAEKIGREPVMVSALVSLNVTSSMNEVMSQLQNRPESPNLYWALVDFPNRRTIFRTGLSGERQFLIGSVPIVAKAEADQELTAAEWKSVFDFLAKMMAAYGDKQKKIDPVADADSATLKQGREEYAERRRISFDQVKKLDPLVVLGPFYYRQYQAAADDLFKLAGLSYPELLIKGRECDERAAKLNRENPGNPFLAFPPALYKYFSTFVHVDRQLAAMTTVEALRSYAAAHDGELPNRLADLTDTPAPDNPATGKPFEYRVENNVAMLSDPRAEGPLTYTIKIRK